MSENGLSLIVVTRPRPLRCAPPLHAPPTRSLATLVRSVGYGSRVVPLGLHGPDHLPKDEGDKAIRVEGRRMSREG